MCKTAESSRLVETTIVPEVWIDGIGKIEKIATDAFRFLLYRTRRPLDGGDEEREIVLSVLTSGATAGAAAVMVTNFLREPAGAEALGVLEIAALLQ